MLLEVFRKVTGVLQVNGSQGLSSISYVIKVQEKDVGKTG
jgi:hypothetical protein